MRRAAAVAVGLLLVAAACSDDGGGTAAPSTTAEPAPPTTAAPIDPASVAADPSPGCGTSTVAAGETNQTVRDGDWEWTYIQHVPPTHDGATPVPLIVDLHGYSESAAIHAGFSMLGPYGDEQGFVTLTPEADYPVPLWNFDTDGDDVRLFGALLDRAEQDLCLDRNRVFVSGLSYGAFFSSYLACDYSDRIAAIAPVAGVQPVDGCELDRPVPVIAFHGTDDPFISYDGGFGPAVADLPTPDGSSTFGDEADQNQSDADQGPSVPEIAATWAGRDGCATEPTEEPIADDVTLLRYDCPVGDEVELYRIEGGGHTWPGSEFSRSVESVVGYTTFSIDANELIWSFFQDHPLGV